MESTKVKARVICNPAASGGGYEPEELYQELEDYELEWITTESAGDATEAAREWRDGLLIVAGATTRSPRSWRVLAWGDSQRTSP